MIDTIDLKKTVETVVQFRTLIQYVKQLEECCKQEIAEADKAFCDLRHYCELQYPVKRSDKNRVCQMLRDYSLRRRKAKDTLEVIEPLAKYITEKPTLNNDIGKITNDMKKQYVRVSSERHYVPRLLTDLFAK